jgi:lipopolysaccharide heptosyltransferase I
MSMKARVPLQELTTSRIAIIKPSALGDIVHSLPVLTALRQRYPAAHLTWIVNRGFEPLLRGHPDLDATLAFDRRSNRPGLFHAASGYLNFFRHLHARHFDLVVDLQGLLRSGVMTLATGAARRVGLSSAREGAGWFYTDVVPAPEADHCHAVDRYWQVAEALGAGKGPKLFRLPVSPAARQWATEVLSPCPRPWLALGVGARWPTKRWPPAHFATLAARAQQRFGGTVVLVGAGDEVELAEAAARRLSGPVRNLTGQTTLPQLAALLAQVEVMLANDTGPLHLAAALGRPVVAPYTCTKVLLNGPYGQAQRAVETRVWCQGSYLKTCSRLECMAELTPDRLWPLLEEVLLAWQRRSRSA